MLSQPPSCTLDDAAVAQLHAASPASVKHATSTNAGPQALILISTPAGRLNLFNASIVLAVACTMSISRLCVRISNCCRAFLSTCGLDKHGVALDPRRQRNRAMHFRVGPLGRVDDLRRALVQHRVVVGFHPNANHLVRMTGHNLLRSLPRVGGGDDTTSAANRRIRRMLARLPHLGNQ